MRRIGGSSPIERVVDSLDGKVDFWNESKTDETTEILTTVLKEWGDEKGMPEDEIVYYIRQVELVGVLLAMQKRGHLEIKCDSYGRRTYRTRRGDVPIF